MFFGFNMAKPCKSLKAKPLTYYGGLGGRAESAD